MSAPTQGRCLPPSDGNLPRLSKQSPIMSSTSYIVRLKDSATEDDLKQAVSKFEAEGGKIAHHHTLFKGFSGSLPNDKVSTLDSLPNVEAVEKDQKVSIQ